jgi:hypothetical protein
MMNGFEVVNIRRIQFVREVKLLGYFYSAVFLVLFCFTVFKLFGLYQDFRTSVYILALVVSLLFSFHIVRRDKVFLRNQIDGSRKKIMLEYLIYSLPFCLPLLFSPHYYLIAVIPVSVYLIAGLKFQFTEKTGARFLSKIISPKDFEWLSGIRKRRFYFGTVYILAAVFSYVPFLPLVFVWMLSVLIYEFYCECEPLNMLRADGYSPNVFLRKKILRHVKLYAALFLPVLAINTLFNPEVIIINLMFVVVQITVLTLAVLMKYKLYTPLDNMQGLYVYIIIIQVITVLPMFMGGIPFLLPLPLILCAKYYSAAKNNLIYYL